MRQFPTGAKRDTDEGKYDFEGFLSPVVLQKYAAYMHKHTTLTDGTKRASDDWQAGMPNDVYMKSLWRHFMDVWTAHRQGTVDEEALCAVLFNTMGLLHQAKPKTYRRSQLYSYEGDRL